ncbi:hypothetical protein SNEBB_000323 [Seison nebaliae]|nr:hypothetical protein SNEBB_000323 [Seison nebaliae]
MIDVRQIETMANNEQLKAVGQTVEIEQVERAEVDTNGDDVTSTVDSKTYVYKMEELKDICELVKEKKFENLPYHFPKDLLDHKHFLDLSIIRNVDILFQCSYTILKYVTKSYQADMLNDKISVSLLDIIRQILSRASLKSLTKQALVYEAYFGSGSIPRFIQETIPQANHVTNKISDENSRISVALTQESFTYIKSLIIGFDKELDELSQHQEQTNIEYTEMKRIRSAVFFALIKAIDTKSTNIEIILPCIIRETVHFIKFVKGEFETTTNPPTTNNTTSAISNNSSKKTIMDNRSNLVTTKLPDDEAIVH